ncbi:FAD-dependent oxidoreductase [Erythrobacter sp.]|uniref:NAD(P)/FAD-dependent oxidoreductase n=1 Tax=Erythrobacter sp. TaxID=1042 RepID=UPI001B0EA456|nr:FAD-dependent oxidoreductase [Erythrobacter sp.]MBO6525909.1 FAD-binding oxidoreductase [Erythrobacter sp.]MBO6529416.1 FAD-binding oxidoreductase [Erythrobacter sp.]
MKQVDFLVVGAGIAGLSAAARLARHGETVVCEAEDAPGVHASGRSAAFAHFDMDAPLVRALTAASLPLLEAPGAEPHPALFVGLEGQAAALDRLEANYRAWAPQVRRLSVAEARELVPVLRAGKGGIVGALLDPQGRKLDAHALLEGHRKALLAAGGTIAAKAPVTGLRHDGGRWIVDTPGASYDARVVVNAAGAWVDAVAGLAGVSPIGIRPLRRTVITFDVPIDVAAWPFTKTVGPGFYIEPEGIGRLLACPMDEGASEPCDAQPEEEDVALAAWRVEQATSLTIPRLAGKWAGLRSFTPDRRPVAGFDPSAPGFFWLAGQGGFGLQTSPAMALAAEALATGGDWPEELRAVGVGAEMLSPKRAERSSD